MAAPDRLTTAGRLKELLDQLSGFKSKPFILPGNQRSKRGAVK